MVREDMVECAALVGQALAVCRLDMGKAAVPVLEQALELLMRAPTEQRRKQNERQRRHRANKKAASRDVTVTQRDTGDVDSDSVVVVEEEVEVEVVGEVVEEEVGALVEAKPPRLRASLKVGAVYEHYKTYHPRCAPKLPSGGKEYKLIAAALVGLQFSVEDCKAAIDGYHRSPFHNGVNDRGTKYLGLGLIFRSADHITKGIEMSNDATLGRAMSERERRGVQAALNWADR